MNYSDTNTIISRSLHNEYETKFSSANDSNVGKQEHGRLLKLTTALATVFTATFFITQLVLF